MITDALLSILYAFVSFIAGFFTVQADVPITNTLTTAITTAAGYFNAMNFIFPFTTIFAIIVFELTFEGIFFIYKLIRWGYSKVPGVN